MLKNFWPPVDSSFAQVVPVKLKNDKHELTGRWRFDIVVKPHKTVVQYSQKETAYYRQGPRNVSMTPAELVQKVRAEPAEAHQVSVQCCVSSGRPGMWADIPQDIEVKHSKALPQLKKTYASIKAIADDGEHGQEFIKRVFSSILGGQPVYSVGYAADDSQLVKEQVLGQRPDLGDVVTHVLPHIQVRRWKRVGLALGMKKSTLNGLGQQFPNDDDRYLETLSYWLEHGSSVTWKTLLDVLGLSEMECTMAELRGKIVSELGGAHQVSLQCCVLSEGAVWCAVWRRQVLLSCHVCISVCAASSSSSQMAAVSGGGTCCSSVIFVLFCLLFSSFLLLLPSNPLYSSVSLYFPYALRSLSSWPAPQGLLFTLRGQQS